jgi:hypothetical protein
VVGTFNTQRGASFVRRNDETQSWLVKGDLVADRLPTNWLDKHLIDVVSGRVMRVEIAREDGQLAIAKVSPEQPHFEIERLPAGRELMSEYEPNGIASVLAGLQFDDVAKAGTVDTSAGSPLTATYRTFDGLVVVIHAVNVDGKHYATLEASVDDARADIAAKAAQLNEVAAYNAQQKSDKESASNDTGTAAAVDAGTPPRAVSDAAGFVAERRKAIDDEAAALNARAKGWQYVLPAFKYANIDKRLEDLLKPRA